MNEVRYIVTVDGLAASGKSALAKGLAKKLGLGHLNSGLLYRAVALLVLRAGLDLKSSGDAVCEMSKHLIELRRDEAGSSLVLIDGLPCGAELIATEVSTGASLIARHQEVRDRLLGLQRDAFKPAGVVAEGRDMGTVVFPGAPVKFFVTAKLDVRAQRRYVQLKGTSQESSLESITRDLEERDRRDSTSAVGTMKQAEGAIAIDNSTETLESVIEKMAGMVREALSTSEPPTQR
jgi:cytidylate kinase